MDARGFRRLLDGTIGAAIGAGLAMIFQVGAREVAADATVHPTAGERGAAERGAILAGRMPAAASSRMDETLSSARIAGESASPRRARAAAPHDRLPSATERTVADGA